MEVITQGAVSKKAVSSVDFHLMQDVLIYGGLFDRLANAETDEEMEQIGREMQALEKEKLPAFYNDAREYHFELVDILSLIDGKIKRLEEAKAGFERVLDRHDDAIHKTMTMLGTKKVQLEAGSLSLRGSGNPPVEITDEPTVPDSFRKFSVTVKGEEGRKLSRYVHDVYPDAEYEESVVKADVKKALKAGQDVPGARLGEETESLLVK